MASEIEEKRGSIAFFATYRPPVPLDIFSCPRLPPPTSNQDEHHMTDGVSYNHNGQTIPPEALKIILERPQFASFKGKEADIDSGRLSGLLFVSERGNLETLHIALRFNDNGQVQVSSFSDVFGTTFDGVRMEDSGCIAGDYLIYVSTKNPSADRRQPWTAVYKTNLRTGETNRLTPSAHADLSPSVSPCGKKIAVASFQRKRGWHGEIEDLNTAIFVMNVERPYRRRLVVRKGGWPTWGSDNVLFFHRKDEKGFWGVFRAEISDNGVTSDTPRVTPKGIDAITPAAINPTTVAVAIIRKKSKLSDKRQEAKQYRHIEIFDSTRPDQPVQITQNIRPKADHFNPFVIDGGKRIGYHCGKADHLMRGDDIERKFHKLKSPDDLDAGVFRVSGVFPTFSSDGSKLAFVDNEFKSLYVADKGPLRKVFEATGRDSIFCPVWNANAKKDLLYFCMGPSFSADKTVHICAIPNASSGNQHHQRLTVDEDFNNAFPSTNQEGTKLVFRSTRAGRKGKTIYKNLYIMPIAEVGEYGRGKGKTTRLTEGEWTDTHCIWSPRGDWIVFSSTRDKPAGAPEKDNDLDPGYFGVYLVKADDPSVVVRVIASGSDIAGHVNHPFFSPDGMSIVVTADLAAVSVDPMSLPLFEHSVRPYGDIFTVDIDPNDIEKNKDVKKFNRITHSRYENSTGTWTRFSTHDPTADWNRHLDEFQSSSCPYLCRRDEAESSFLNMLLLLVMTLSPIKMFIELFNIILSPIRRMKPDQT